MAQLGSARARSDQHSVAQLGTAQVHPHAGRLKPSSSSNHIGTAWFGAPAVPHRCPAPALSLSVPRELCTGNEKGRGKPEMSLLCWLVFRGRWCDEVNGWASLVTWTCCPWGAHRNLKNQLPCTGEEEQSQQSIFTTGTLLGACK